MLSRSKQVALTLVMVSTSLGATARASEIEANDPASVGNTQRVLGVVVASAGLVGFGASVYLGRERAKRDEVTAHCSVDVCQSMGSLLVEDARSQSNTAFRLMSASALAMASGVAIYFLAPRYGKKSVLSGAGVALGAGGITFKTTF
ncbi:MAG: hypothetical protein ACXWUG_06550 [Polyangiales bacterium]